MAQRVRVAALRADELKAGYEVPDGWTLRDVIPGGDALGTWYAVVMVSDPGHCEAAAGDGMRSC